jgi:hypothetical protein
MACVLIFFKNDLEPSRALLMPAAIMEGIFINEKLFTGLL